MSGKGAIGACVVLLAAGAVFWLLSRPGPPASTEVEASASGPAAPETDTPAAGDMAPRTDRQPVPQPEPPEPAQAKPWLWPLDDCRRDADGILMDLGPYLHKSINRHFSGDEHDRRLDVGAILKSKAVNPRQLALTREERQELDRRLARHHDMFAELGPRAQQLLGVAYHEAVERGELILLGKDESTIAQRQRELIDEHTQRYGPQFEQFVWLLLVGPFAYDAADKRLPPPNDTYLVCLPRAQAPEAFVLQDTLRSVRGDAVRIATEYVAGIQR